MLDPEAAEATLEDKAERLRRQAEDNSDSVAAEVSHFVLLQTVELILMLCPVIEYVRIVCTNCTFTSKLHLCKPFCYIVLYCAFLPSSCTFQDMQS